MIPGIPPGAPGASLVLDSRSSAIGFKNPTTGRISIPSQQFGRANIHQRQLTFSRNGLLRTLALSSGGVKSYLNQLTIPANCVGVQIGYQNADPTAQPQIRIKVGFTESAPSVSSSLCALTVGGITPSVSGTIDAQYVALTIGGNNTPNIRAFSGATIYAPFINWTDIYPIRNRQRTDAGRTWPVMNVITEVAAYQNNIATALNITEQFFSSNITGWEVDDPASMMNGHFYRCRSGAVFGGVTPSAMNQTTQDTVSSAPILIRIFLQTANGIQVAGVGDSTFEGTGGTVDKLSGLQRAVFAQSTMARPIAYLNACQAGTTPDKFASMAQIMLPEVPNSLLFHPIGSVNQTLPLTNFVASATITSGGTGGTPGTATLTGTTGTGTPFQVTGTISGGGVLTSVDTVSVAGVYTVLPTNLLAEPVTGGGLTGCTLNLNTDSALLPLSQRDIELVRQAAANNGCAAIPITWQPTSVSGRTYAGSDPIRRAMNAALLASGQLCLDYATGLEGSLNGSQVEYATSPAAVSTDGLHQNDEGHRLDSLVAIALLKTFTGL